MALYGERVAIDGGEITLSNSIDGGEISLSNEIDGGELSSVVYVTPNLQSKTATPSEEEQTITADVGYNGLHEVTVEPIPSNYGRITYNGSIIKVWE